MPVSREEVVRLKHTRGRKPVDLIADMPRPQGRDVMWQAIRARRKFTILDLEGDTRINDRTIETYVRGLVLAGFLKTHKASKAVGVRATYELVKDQGVDAPRVTRKGKPVTQGDGRLALWTAMRGLRDFNFRELQAITSTPQREIALEEVRDYVANLAKARYLKLMSKSKPGTPARYSLIPSRNTGPKAPQIQRIQQVFDPNENRVVWPFKEGA